MNKKKSKVRIYLDHASTTPVDESVFRAMKPFFSNQFHNPSSLYQEGVKIKEILDMSRKEVAQVLHAQPDELVFTGSGTESDNLAILGIVKTSKKTISKPHVVISAIEHPGVLELVSEIRTLGGDVTIVDPNMNGIIDPEEVRNVLKASTVLVSIMYANNEIGTIQPIREIAKVIRHFKKTKNLKLSDSPNNSMDKRSLKKSNYPYFHTDASQASNYCNLNVLELGVDLLTLDGSKIYGPKGVGVLFCRRGIILSPVIYGGGQEKGFRSGTENIPAIVGFSKALSLSVKLKETETERLRNLRDYGIKKIEKMFPQASLNGDRINRLPNNINVCFPGIDSEYAVIKADALGVMCSTASSCRTLSENARSYVLDAIGKGSQCSESSLRFTLGRKTTKAEIDYLLKVLPKIVSLT